MVDYNIAIPQQQLFQAPDFTQNAMRMQQAQLQEMQMQALARKNAEARNIQQLYAQPGFDMTSPAAVNQFGQAGGYKAAAAALVAAKQAQTLDRQTAATNAGLEKTYLDIGSKKYDDAQNSLAAIPPGDAQSYANWLSVHGPAYKANGVNLASPEQWAQDPTGKLQSHMVSTSQSARERAARAPVYRDFAGTTLRVDPDNPDVLIEPSIRRAGAPQPGAGTGPATAAMNPDRLAAMQDTQARLGLPPMQPSAAGANAAVNNMPGVPVAPSVGAPVNNMPGVPVPDAGVKNAMRAGPVSAGDFARQQQEEANAQDLQKQRGLEVMKRDVAAAAPPAAMTAAQERTMLNTVSKDRSSAETTISTMDDVLKAVKDVQDLSEGQKGSITGLTSKLPNVTAESRTAQTKLNNLKGIVTQMGKRAASLGGALGNMAVQEWKIVADGIASLDVTNMNAKDLNDQLDVIAAKANAAASRTKDAYERQYEDLNVKHKGRFALSGGTSARGNAAVDGVDTSNPLLR